VRHEALMVAVREVVPAAGHRSDRSKLETGGGGMHLAASAACLRVGRFSEGGRQIGHVPGGGV
jgi:hypothetical protein